MLLRELRPVRVRMGPHTRPRGPGAAPAPVEDAFGVAGGPHLCPLCGAAGKSLMPRRAECPGSAERGAEDLPSGGGAGRGVRSAPAPARQLILRYAAHAAAASGRRLVRTSGSRCSVLGRLLASCPNSDLLKIEVQKVG